MQIAAVTSSNIQAIGHNGATLYVKFLRGAVYSYAGVSEALFDELKFAESVGKFLNSTIKPYYEATRLTYDPFAPC